MATGEDNLNPVESAKKLEAADLNRQKKNNEAEEARVAGEKELEATYVERQGMLNELDKARVEEVKKKEWSK